VGIPRGDHAGIRDRAALDRVYGKVNDSPAAAKATMARLKGVWSSAPQWSLDRNRGRSAVPRLSSSSASRSRLDSFLGRP
jgi:hypothetical protein